MATLNRSVSRLQGGRPVPTMGVHIAYASMSRQRIVMVGTGRPPYAIAYVFCGYQNQSCQTGVTPAGSGGSASNSTRASPGA
jgi:hypothetical protein